MGMSITETVYLFMYLSLVAKKTETKKKSRKLRKRKLHMPYEVKSVLKI